MTRMSRETTVRRGMVSARLKAFATLMVAIGDADLYRYAGQVIPL